MKRFVFAIMAILSVFSVVGCNNGQFGTIGNGKIDQIEAVAIRAGVGAALSAKPEIVPVVYGVSTALLAIIANDPAITVSSIDYFFNEEVERLKISNDVKKSFADFVIVSKEEIMKIANIPDVTDNKVVVVITDFLKIIQSVSHDMMVK